MKITNRFDSGQTQEAEVTYEEFQELNFKHDTAKILGRLNTKENIERIIVRFNKKGECVWSKAFAKRDDNQVDVAKMFNQLEEAIKTKNVDRETAHAASFDKLGI